MSRTSGFSDNFHLPGSKKARYPVDANNFIHHISIEKDDALFALSYHDTNIKTSQKEEKNKKENK